VFNDSRGSRLQGLVRRLDMVPWDFPGGAGVKTPCSQCRGVQVQFLVRELRSCMLHSVTKTKRLGSRPPRRPE